MILDKIFRFLWRLKIEGELENFRSETKGNDII